MERYNNIRYACFNVFDDMVDFLTLWTKRQKKKQQKNKERGEGLALLLLNTGLHNDMEYIVLYIRLITQEVRTI